MEGISNKTAGVFEGLTAQDRTQLQAAFDARKTRVPPVYETYHLEKDAFLDLVYALSDAAPRRRDLLRAFEVADRDRSGGIDSEELMALYARIKRGEVEGISGGGLVGWLFGGRRRR